MATFKKFSDIDGQTIELGALAQMNNSEFVARWPGVKGIRADGYSMWVSYPLVGEKKLFPVTRMIEMKRNPSKHECNAKCMNGKHNGACECRCEGKNHGRGMFTKLMAA